MQRTGWLKTKGKRGASPPEPCTLEVRYDSAVAVHLRCGAGGRSSAALPPCGYWSHRSGGKITEDRMKTCQPNCQQRHRDFESSQFYVIFFRLTVHERMSDSMSDPEFISDSECISDSELITDPKMYI